MMWLAAALAYLAFEPPHARVSRELRAWYGVRHRRVARDERDAVARCFASWAADHGLALDQHDARYIGRLEGCEVVLDTGIRDSGAYDVVVELRVTSPAGLSVHRRNAPGPFVRAFRASAVISIRLDTDTLELRFAPASSPADVDAAVAEVLATIRRATHAGAYR